MHLLEQPSKRLTGPAKHLGLLIAGLSLLLPAGCSDSPASTESVDVPEVLASHGRPEGVPAPIFGVRVWGNDQEWQALAPQEPSPANERSHAQWIVMGAVDDTDPHSPFFFGDHDHVMSVPKGNRGSFSAVWHLVFVVPGDDATVGTDVLVRDPPFPTDKSLVPVFDPGPLAYAADLDQDGMVEAGEELTSLAKVEKAEALGLVKIEDQWADVLGDPLIFICPIRPL